MVKGWCKTNLEDNDGRVCLVGARNKVLDLSMVDGYEADYTSDLIESVIGGEAFRGEDPETLMWTFNDECDSLNQVLDVLDEAIYVEKGRLA